MTNHSGLSPDDELLATLLQQIFDSPNDQREHFLKKVEQQYPELQQEFRELWATARLANDLGSVRHTHLNLSSSEPRHTESPNNVQHPKQVGDYRVESIIGRGGMGVVYRARQQSLERDVALKMLLQGQFARQEDLIRFQREAEAAAGLKHPHIVPVYEIGLHQGLPFFSMKLIEGTTLAEKLHAGPLPAREAATLLIPICRAIADAHQHGILHRDLKPSNILIDQSDQPFISDFGLAKRVDPSKKQNRQEQAEEPTIIGGSKSYSLTQSGAILGTPGYMAPEQAAGQRQNVGCEADIYSLGTLLYAMLTGRAPFIAESPVDVVFMVLEQEPILPRLLNPNADADLEMIALKAIQKPKELRYSSANALADDLEAYLVGNPISARSSRFNHLISRTFRETHHAVILENWGLLWMLHAAVLLLLTTFTNVMQYQGVSSRWPFLLVWGGGLSSWALLFWKLRQRAGPVTFVERQIAHVWGGSMVVCVLLYMIEWIMDLPVLTLSPTLALVSGWCFLLKGEFSLEYFIFNRHYCSRQLS